MVTLDVHGRDVLTMMVEAGCESTNDFNWIAQLRIYYDAEGTGNESFTKLGDGSETRDVFIKMITATCKYGWEYLGNSFRLVVTSLTDRCYRTLMGALQLVLGGAPEGPAGTGKTETTKDLAKALAKQCVVFNCSDGLDYIAMGKFFKGLAASGAWACFDEFNRIDLEVLSVVAQQVLTIQRADRGGRQALHLRGDRPAIDPTCAIFITMNPGYAGRSELPDNLKALFRPVAMMVPDYALIGEIMLYSFGYSTPATRQKIVQTYKLCSEQLSSPGPLRLRHARGQVGAHRGGQPQARLPRRGRGRCSCCAPSPTSTCPSSSRRTCRSSTASPPTSSRASSCPRRLRRARGAMNTICERGCRSPLIPIRVRLLRAQGRIQTLRQMFLVRHGFMIVGLPFSGKTTSYRTSSPPRCSLLAERSVEALRQGRCHPCLNPKSITMGQLYGEFDAVTHEWTDGILAIIYRNAREDHVGATASGCSSTAPSTPSGSRT